MSGLSVLISVALFILIAGVFFGLLLKAATVFSWKDSAGIGFGLAAVTALLMVPTLLGVES